MVGGGGGRGNGNGANDRNSCERSAPSVEHDVSPFSGGMRDFRHKRRMSAPTPKNGSTSQWMTL
jgi:hypothetical protein